MILLTSCTAMSCPTAVSSSEPAIAGREAGRGVGTGERGDPPPKLTSEHRGEGSEIRLVSEAHAETQRGGSEELLVDTGYDASVYITRRMAGICLGGRCICSCV